MLKCNGKEFQDEKAFGEYLLQQDAETQAQRAIAWGHAATNTVLYPSKRPAETPERRCDNLFIGEKLYYGDVVQSRFISGKTEWLNWMTPTPAKKFTLILERTKTETCDAPIPGYQKITELITRWEYAFVLEGETLKSNAWLNPSDVTEICPFYVLFLNGFKHDTHPSAAALCKEVEGFTPIRTSNVIQAAAPTTPGKTKTKTRTNQSWPEKDQRYILSKWKAYKAQGETRHLDCYEEHKKKIDFPEKIKSCKDFKKCLETARKNELRQRTHKTHWKNAGK